MKRLVIVLGLMAVVTLQSCIVRVGGYDHGHGYHHHHHHHGYYR